MSLASVLEYRVQIVVYTTMLRRSRIEQSFPAQICNGDHWTVLNSCRQPDWDEPMYSSTRQGLADRAK